MPEGQGKQPIVAEVSEREEEVATEAVEGEEGATITGRIEP